MPKYVVKHRSFIDGRLYEPGDEIEYEGDAGHNLVAPGTEVKKPDSDIDPEKEKSLQEVREMYEQLFGTKPGNMKEETMQQKIDEKKKELGVV